MYELDEIGQISPAVSFTGGEMACSKMVKVSCGAPAFEVKAESIKPEGYLVWFLEYDVEHLVFRNETDPEGLELLGLSSEKISLDPNFDFSERAQ